jgi:hypothetical protein
VRTGPDQRRIAGRLEAGATAGVRLGPDQRKIAGRLEACTTAA